MHPDKRMLGSQVGIKPLLDVIPYDPVVILAFQMREEFALEHFALFAIFDRGLKFVDEFSACAIELPANFVIRVTPNLVYQGDDSLCKLVYDIAIQKTWGIFRSCAELRCNRILIRDQPALQRVQRPIEHRLVSALSSQDH